MNNFWLVEVDTLLRVHGLLTNWSTENAKEVVRLLFLISDLEERVVIMHTIGLTLLTKVKVVALSALVPDTHDRHTSTSIASVSLVHHLSLLSQFFFSSYLFLHSFPCSFVYAMQPGLFALVTVGLGSFTLEALHMSQIALLK